VWEFRWEVVVVVVKSGECLVGIFPGCTEEERGRRGEREGKESLWSMLDFIF
jgi:hypothetical protein